MENHYSNTQGHMKMTLPPLLAGPSSVWMSESAICTVSHQIGSATMPAAHAHSVAGAIASDAAITTR